MHHLRALLAGRALRYGLTLALLALVLWKAQPGRMLAAAGSADPRDLALALALTPPFLALKALRWQVMLRAGGIEAGFGESAYSLIAGMGLALVTPARLGELARAAYLRDPRKLKIGGLVMIDKGFDVLVLAGLSVAGAWTLLGHWAGAALAAVTIAGLFAVYEPRPVRQLLERAGSRLPFRARLDRVWSSLACLSPRMTTIYLVLTVLAFAAVLVQFGLILLSWVAWSPRVVLLTFPLVILTNILPLTVGGLGIREGTAALLLSHYHVSPAHAAVAAFLMFALNTALPGLIGAILTPFSAPRRSAVAGPADRL